MRVWRDEGDDGSASLATVVAVGVALHLFALLANVVVLQYAGGALRAALDEGVRAGSAAGRGAGDCLERIDQVLSGLLGGTYREAVTSECREEGALIRAGGAGDFPGLVPPMPTIRLEYEAVAAREPG